MSAADRPWWSSGDADASGAGAPEPDDPLEAHRRARRGDAGGDHAHRRGQDPVDDGSWWVPATEAVIRLARDLAAHAGEVAATPVPDPDHHGDADDRDADNRGGDADGRDGDGGAHRIDACGVCPICIGLRVLGDARPEVVGHLAEAARQLTLAVRAVVDAAADGHPTGAADRPTDGGRDGRHRRDDRDGLQHIDLDG